MGTWGSSCDIWTREQEESEAQGSLICNQECNSSADCAMNLFCDSNWSICMDLTTSAFWGPNCDSHRGDGQLVDPEHPVNPLAPGQPSSYDGYQLIGEALEC